ncbi:MAG TPA: NAD(P)H-dependent glycerol-3-phosphate dehydrogenase [Acidimicrobiales bacterium]|nr:NAD(P)H-dependent glycerol-3-phosphate dehydrogenase [Acidimicrobiales bacterium]
MAVAVLGAGSWGTALSTVSARHQPVRLWARRPALAEEINSSRRNPEYLSEFCLADEIVATADMAEAVSEASLVVMAAPSHGFRAVLAEAAPFLGPDVPVLSLAKGLEAGSLLRMTEVIDEVAPGRPRGVLTGPNLAREVIEGQPTASVVAMTDAGACLRAQALLSTDTFRVYTNDDVVGCEIAGALKNVMAIAAGLSDGLGFGDNSKAALITRGLAELTRPGVAIGGRPLTFAGLAGMGDLVATCISQHSRNRSVGVELARGRSIDDIVDSMKMVAEGVKTAPVVVELARRHGVDMPIADQVVAVLEGHTTAHEVIPALMQRQAKPELYGMN